MVRDFADRTDGTYGRISGDAHGTASACEGFGVPAAEPGFTDTIVDLAGAAAAVV